MKKLLSMLLAAAMLVSASAMAFAEGTSEKGTIVYGSSTEIGGDFAPSSWWTNNATDKMIRDLTNDYGVTVTNQGGEYVVNPTIAKNIESVVNPDGSKTFTVTINEGNTITVTDNGRGIPVDIQAQTGKPAGAMVLPDGSVVTGKTSSLLGASAALLLNALKAMAGIDHKLKLIPASVIEPISRLKTGNLGHRNPRLHSDEVLIALAISGLTNPLAAMVQEQLRTLRGCDAHFSVIISEEDEKLYKRLGINVTCQPRYEVKKLYHK